MKKVDFNATICDFFYSADELLYESSCMAVNDKQINEINKNRSRLWAIASRPKELVVKEENGILICVCNDTKFSFTKYGFLPYFEHDGYRFINEKATQQYDVFLQMIKTLPEYYRKVKAGIHVKSEECEILHLYKDWKYLCGRKNVIRNLMYRIPSDAFFAKKVKCSKSR